MSADRPVALLTGASSEVGQAIAARLAAAGVAVVGTSRAPAAPSSDFAAWHAGDITDPAHLSHLVSTLGRLDHFVHAAGHRFTYGRFHLADPADMERLWAVDYQALATLCRLCLPLMMGRRFGRIVALTSLSARVAGPGAATYAAVKSACEGLMRGLATDYARFRITANAVAPGAIANARLEARLGAEAAGKVRQLVSPEDVARVVAFCCDEGAGAVTGQTLTVAAGLDLLGRW